MASEIRSIRYATGQAAQTTGISIGAISEKFVEMYQAADGNIGTINRLNDALFDSRTAAGQRIEQLDAELACYDPLNEALIRLSSQYQGLDDQTLRGIAKREKRLDDLRKRSQEEKKEQVVTTGASTGTLKIQIENLQSPGAQPFALGPEQIQQITAGVLARIGAARIS